ncbi:MAG: hypothetical protein PHD74_04405 [Candidatus Krumholzibacteria bacterium]|nr:hypothetical protein [Candidatus Krumholzibacteria bacterium]
MMNEELYSKASYALIVAGVLVLSLFIITAPMHRVLTVIPDDAAYYFKIAQNVSEGRGLTFDGINRTNGFQPLWLCILIPFYSIVRGDPEAMCRIVIVLQGVLLALAAVLLNAVLVRFFSKRAAFVSLLLFMFFIFVQAANGMESAVLILSLSALLLFGARTHMLGPRDARRDLILGMLLGFVVLARLDMVFVPLVVLGAKFGGALIAREGRSVRVARSAAVLCGFAAIFVPYAVYNRVSFGSVMPISGALKSSFPRATLSDYAFSTLGKRGLLGLAMAFAYLLWRVVRPRRPMDPPGNAGYFRSAMAVMACAILLHFLHTILFMRWAVFGWHYVPYILFGVVMVCEPLDRLLSCMTVKRSGFAYWIAVAAIVVIGCSSVFRNLNRSPEKSWHVAAYDAALWARQNTGPLAIFAMKDAGTFGYFSERSVINLDGVVNNREYQAALREKNLNGYLAVKGVRFIVQHAFWNRPDIISGDYDAYEISYRSRLFDSDSEPVVLRKVDEAYRSRPYFDGPYETVFIIWNIGRSE